MKRYKKFVAYFDILGYGERITGKTIEEEYKIQKALIEDINKSIRSSREIIKCNVISFSDTHILYSEDFSRIVRGSLLFMLLAAVRSTPYFPVRGAIAYGDFLFDEKTTIIIGHALREAYPLAEAQEWMGCCLSDSARIAGEKHPAFKYFLEKGVLVKYNVPFKDNKKERRYVINMESFPRVWGYQCKDMPLTRHDFIENIFKNRGFASEGILKFGNKVEIKLKNTQSFFAYVEKIKNNFKNITKLI